MMGCTSVKENGDITNSYMEWHKLKKYTTSQKFLDSKIFNVFFFRYLFSAYQACIFLIQNTAKAVILWNIFTI